MKARKTNKPMSKKNELLEEFFMTMFKVRRVIDRSFAVSPGETAVSLLRVQTLSYLNKYPHSTVSQLAEELHMTSSAITQFVERLVQAGLVVRNNDAKDRRVTRLSLSKKGVQALETFPTEVKRRMHKVFSRIPEEDIREVTRIFSNLLTEIKDEEKSI